MTYGFIGPIKPKQNWTYNEYLVIINGEEVTQ